jgi:hypothetical protein
MLVFGYNRAAPRVPHISGVARCRSSSMPRRNNGIHQGQTLSSEKSCTCARPLARTIGLDMLFPWHERKVPYNAASQKGGRPKSPNPKSGARMRGNSMEAEGSKLTITYQPVQHSKIARAMPGFIANRRSEKSLAVSRPSDSIIPFSWTNRTPSSQVTGASRRRGCGLPDFLCKLRVNVARRDRLLSPP